MHITKTVHLVDAESHPLSDAILNDANVEVIRNLLQQDGSLIHQRRGGHLPIHFAAQQGRVDILMLLLEAGADVNAKVEGDWAGRGNTAICFAVYQDDPQLVSVLIAHGAHTEIKDTAGRPLHEVAASLAGKEVQELIRTENRGTENRDGS